jgi:hypothetical protein
MPAMDVFPLNQSIAFLLRLGRLGWRRGGREVRCWPRGDLTTPPLATLAHCQNVAVWRSSQNSRVPDVAAVTIIKGNTDVISICCRVACWSRKVVPALGRRYGLSGKKRRGVALNSAVDQGV